MRFTSIPNFSGSHSRPTCATCTAMATSTSTPRIGNRTRQVPKTMRSPLVNGKVAIRNDPRFATQLITQSGCPRVIDEITSPINKTVAHLLPTKPPKPSLDYAQLAPLRQLFADDRESLRVFYLPILRPWK